MWDPYQCLYLLAYYCVLALSFFFAGLTLALVYANRGDQVGKAYAWDLAGAGLGCLGILWLSAAGSGLCSFLPPSFAAWPLGY